MLCRSVTPDVVSHSAAISVCEKRKHWEEALRLFFETSHLVVHDVEYSCGLAHRLDTICSGLLLATMMVEASIPLQWQLSGGILMREYMVICHESMPLKSQEVDVHIFHAGGG